MGPFSNVDHRGGRDQGFLLGGAQAAVSWPSADCIKASSSTDAVDHNTHNMLLKFSRQELNHQALHRLKGGPRLINIKCCFSKHCTLARCTAVCTGWPKLPQCVFVFVCVFLCSCVCAHYKLLSCACSIWPRWIHCVCMATYVHLFFASELYGPQPYQTHIMRLKHLCSRTLLSAYYPSVSYMVCKLSVLSLQCRMFILCTVHL